MKSGIYIITNFITNKIYIGSSKNIKVRKNGHVSRLERNIHENSKLQHAWNKYGSECFMFQTLEYVPENKLEEREQYWINELDVVKNGYNISPIAEKCWNRGTKGIMKPNQTSFKKGFIPWNKNLKGIHLSPQSEFKKGMTPWIKGKHHSKESLQKMGLVHVGQIPWNKGKECPSIAQKMTGKNNPMYGLKGKLSPSYGRKCSEETKQKIRLGLEKYRNSQSKINNQMR